ncbi:PAAR domain-containing protein [Neorhizobium sp. JUb45]|uniref:PAAR domain-containing protein n=1 Tax=Neorhizobium sp. JUb45 TaxID=2485113 RepID=UPI0010453BD2|nr:PAAR domain-containing protein [Neorhizobium sp. JUb45]TCR07264.1 putative Zn-binding protein involved in type VI secretion [Neorhizobium sp. JUb45]
MPRIARLGDSGTHGGSIISAASKWKCEGALIARRGDLYACPIHGTNPIVGGSSKWKCEDAEIARHGDATACGASIISGASKWECD